MKLQELFEVKERSVLSVMGKQPEHIKGNFTCREHNLTSLEGSPKTINGLFLCHFNNLKTLKGGPTEVGGNYLAHNNSLISLEGAPSSVGGNFSVIRNELTSLHNIHKQIKHIGGFADFEENPIKSHILGLLLIDGIIAVYLDNDKVQDIINKHLYGERDIFACQEELIEAGFEDFAQL